MEQFIIDRDLDDLDLQWALLSNRQIAKSPNRRGAAAVIGSSEPVTAAMRSPTSQITPLSRRLAAGAYYPSGLILLLFSAWLNKSNH